MRAGARRLLIGLCLSAATFVVLEGIASLLVFAWEARTHFWSVVPERKHSVYDPELGWVSQRSEVVRDLYGPGIDLSTNAQGFRNERDFPREVPPGKTRVVALGDSFTLGYGVADGDSWPARLAQRCPGVEAPNLGQSGYGIDQDYLWYLRDGSALDHQVLVFAFIDHDLDRVRAPDMQGYGKPVLRLVEGELVVQNVPVPRAAYWWPALTQNLRLLESLRLVELARKLADRWFPSPARGSRWALDDEETGRLDEAIFQDLARRARERGTALVLVHLPHLAPGDPSQLAVLPAWQRALLDRLAAGGIAVVDLAAELSALPDPERRSLFLAHSLDAGAAGHYSAAGNDFVARAIASHLTRLGLLPPDACPQ